MKAAVDLRVRVLAGAVLAGIAVLAAWASGRGVSALRARRGEAPEHDAARPARREWRCACGQGFVVSGTDRHRVYWLVGAADDDPVLDHDCPQCGRPLPVEHESTAG